LLPLLLPLLLLLLLLAYAFGTSTVQRDVTCQHACVLILI
jgi:hypothetical protein